mmetsp:Transcript_73545/g.186404  ORF Transcript_73545/g.186404 Transcript_73545/m.186404 type:complete len:234 (-) Transcript_73545:210-911(-)
MEDPRRIAARRVHCPRDLSGFWQRGVECRVPVGAKTPRRERQCAEVCLGTAGCEYRDSVPPLLRIVDGSRDLKSPAAEICALEARLPYLVHAGEAGTLRVHDAVADALANINELHGVTCEGRRWENSTPDRVVPCAEDVPNHHRISGRKLCTAASPGLASSRPQLPLCTQQTLPPSKQRAPAPSIASRCSDSILFNARLRRPQPQAAQPGVRLVGSYSIRGHFAVEGPRIAGD